MPARSTRDTSAITSCSSMNSSRAQLYEKGEMIVERMKRIPGVVAVGRTNIGVATTNNQQYLADPARHQSGSEHRPVSGGRRLPRRDGNEAGRRSLVRSEAADGRHDHALTRRDPNIEQALLPRAESTSSSTSSRQRSSGSKSPQDAVGKTIRSEIIGPDDRAYGYQHHRRRPRRALPVGSHADSSRSCSRTSIKAPAP